MSLVKVRAALETALNVLPALITPATISTSVNGVFNTTGPHNLKTGVVIKIAGHTILNGTYKASYITDTSFALLDKVSNAQIATNLSGTGGVVTAQLTAWENTSFEPIVDVPYQEVYLMPATPDNPSYGGGFHREIGYLQVNLYYPRDLGTTDIGTRAELIRTNFDRGNSFANGSVTVHIKRTPSVTPGANLDSFIQYVVKIEYWADIYS